ncbi:MAG: CIA30 family protein [Cyanobacteria bacterium J06632_22]
MASSSKPSSSSQWDLGRFWQTLDFFEAVPIWSWIQQMFFDAPPPPAPQIQNAVVFDFRQATEEMRQIWGALDDVVMGGVSQSSVQLCPEGLMFSGQVSTENSGGFASVRSRNFEPPLNLSTYTGIELTVRGDGQRYKFFLRDGNAWDSVAYAYSFDTTADEWVTVRIPFEQMQPVLRARVVERPPLNAGRIYSLQFMLSKFEYDRALNPRFAAGPFQLLIQAVRVY